MIPHKKDSTTEVESFYAFNISYQSLSILVQIGSTDMESYPF